MNDILTWKGTYKEKHVKVRFDCLWYYMTRKFEGNIRKGYSNNHVDFWVISKKPEGFEKF